MSNVDNNSVNNVSVSGEESRLELYVNLEWKEIEVYKGLKIIPSSWSVRPLGELAKVQKGQNLTRKDAKKGVVPVVAGGKRPAGFHDIANRPGGSITVSASGANAGYIAYYEMPIFATDCSTVLANEIEQSYLFRSLLGKQNEITKLQVGGAQPHVYPSDLQLVLIEFPENRTEQSLIAQALSTQEAQVADLCKLAALERQRLTWLSDELLSGRLRVVEDPTAEPVVVSRDDKGEPVEVLPGVRLVENDVFISCTINGKKSFIPDGWQNKKIKDIVDRRKEKTNSSRNYVGLENVTQNTGAYIESSGAKVVEGSTSSVFQRGDLLYGKLRPYLKKVWLADFSGTCSTEFLVLSPKCNPFFLKAHLLGEDVTDIACGMSEGTRMPRTDWHTIGNIDIMCPPSNEQSLIAAVLTAQEKQAADIERLADLEQKRLEWLSDELLSGRLRIKVPA